MLSLKIQKERQISSMVNLARFCDEHKENFDPHADLKLAQIRDKTARAKKMLECNNGGFAQL